MNGTGLIAYGMLTYHYADDEGTQSSFARDRAPVCESGFVRSVREGDISRRASAAVEITVRIEFCPWVSMGRLWAAMGHVLSCQTKERN